MERQCPKCGAPLEEGAAFCTACGEAVRRCPNCGATVGSAENFCSECGTKVSADSSIPVLAIAKKSNKKWILLCAAVVFIIGGGILFTKNDTPAPSSNAVTTISVKANDMIDDYVRDQTGAEAHYKNQSIKITGQLIQKYQFKNTQDYALVIATKVLAGKSYDVILDLPSDKAAEANKVKFGDFVSAEGQCVGIVKQESPTVISVQIKTDKIN